MLGAQGTFGRSQPPFGVDLLLELVEHGFARGRSAAGPVLCVGPGFVCGDLTAK